ncbi:MAG: pimeloyl-ACP methyl ester carboxylesterase [Myxococcota bacterium]|jgi:pimeloyl-ACP methyl ester carboxylesterase
MSHAPVFLDRPGGRIAFERIGSGPAIVCVPGIGDVRSSYRLLAPLLVSAGYTVYLMDLRGHGDSDATFASYTTEDIGDDIVALLEFEGLTDSTLAGCSIGGGAIAWAAASAPDRVGRLVMLNPFVRDLPGSGLMRALIPVMFAWPWGLWMWLTYRARLFVTPPTDHAQATSELRTNLKQTGRMRSVRGMMTASKIKVEERLGEVKAHTLVIMGADDIDYPDPRAEGETVLDRIAGTGRVEVIDQSGHYPQTEHPQQVADLMIGFLKSNDGVGSSTDAS